MIILKIIIILNIIGKENMSNFFFNLKRYKLIIFKKYMPEWRNRYTH